MIHYTIKLYNIRIDNTTKNRKLHKFATTNSNFEKKLIISYMHHRITYMYINFQPNQVSRSVKTDSRTKPPGQNPPDKTPRTKPPPTKTPGQTPPGQNPPGQNPPGQNPPGQNPPGQNPPGQNPPDKTPPGKTPPDKTPPDKTPRTKPPTIIKPYTKHSKHKPPRQNHPE